jgi:hypothetical protein
MALNVLEIEASRIFEKFKLDSYIIFLCKHGASTFIIMKFNRMTLSITTFSIAITLTRHSGYW